MRPHPSPAVVDAQAAERELPGTALAELDRLAAEGPDRLTRRLAKRAAARARRRAAAAELDELYDVDRAGARYRHLDARARRKTGR